MPGEKLILVKMWRQKTTEFLGYLLQFSKVLYLTGVFELQGLYGFLCFHFFKGCIYTSQALFANV